jgi:hypothetical protein
MKKVLVLLLLAMTLWSCSIVEGSCNCGLVTSDDIQDYSVTIRNNCSNNTRRFTLSPGDWMNAFVGEQFCITNVGEW